MKKAIITGGGSGLGKLLVRQMSQVGYQVFVVDKNRGHDVREPDNIDFGDFLDNGIDALINCAGVNGINWLRDVTAKEYDEIMDTNCKAIFRMTQRCVDSLAVKRGAIVNIVSNAAHMPMRCSAAYNASKGAALILTKQLARELINEGITVFSVSPNKLKGTGMSDAIDEQVMKTRGWSKKQAVEYQLQGLLTGEETDPAAVAEFIAFLLSEKYRHKALAGCDLQYGL